MDVKQTIYVYNTIERKFKGIRCTMGHMTPVNWTLTVKLSGINDISLTGEKSNAHLNKVAATFQKLQWWIDSYLDDVYACSMFDVDFMDTYYKNKIDNVLLTTQGEPMDSVISEALTKKLTVLATDYVEIIGVELHSDDFQSTFHFSESGGYGIPMTNAGISEFAVYDEPWWCRHDCDLWEPTLLEGVEKEEIIELTSTSAEADAIYEASLRILNGEHLEEEGKDLIPDPEAECIIIPMKELWVPKQA